MSGRRLQCFLVAFVAGLLVLGPWTGTALASRLPVVVWGQKDPRWASLRLGGSHLTMGNSGCAVTAAAMVADYFGSTKNPGQLVAALDANGGLDASGSLSFEKVPGAAGGTLAFVQWYATDLNRINRELDSGDPVIAQVWLFGTINHFVVITGHSGGTYFVNDPWYGDTSTINARYGNPATAIRSIIIFHGRHAVGPVLALRGNLTHPAGVVRRGDAVPITLTVANSGDQAGTWSPLTLSVRSPFGQNADVTITSTLTLAAGESRSLQVSFRPDWTGTWTIWLSGSRSGAWDQAGDDPATVITVSPTQPPSPPFLERVGGSDRYQTAVSLSKKGFPTGASAVVLVTGTNYPDALCAAPLARAYGGPILLVSAGGLTPEVTAELRRLGPAQVFLVGLGSAVRDQVAAALPSATLVSIAGQDRYQTAALVADELKLKLGSVSQVVVAPGDSFPDGLAAAALAAWKGWPVLLSPQSGAVPAATAAEILKLGVDSALVVGTYARVGLTHVTREVGADRYATSALIAQYAKLHGAAFSHVALATGLNYPDALVSGAYLAKDGGILLLTAGETVPAPVATLLGANAGAVQYLDFIALPTLAARVGG